MRQRSTERAMLSADRTRIKNRIHSVLHQRLIEAPSGDLFSAQNLAWLKALALDPFGAMRSTAISANSIASNRNSPRSPNRSPCTLTRPRGVKLLMTLPGVDFTVAETILAALGDLSRFETPDKAASYLGLVPSTRQSGDRCYHGPLPNRSPPRPLAAGAGRAACRPASRTHRRVLPPHREKEDRNVAVVAVAHKLVVLAWHMLKNNEPYRYAQPKTLQAKLSRLRILATKQKRKGGSSRARRARRNMDRAARRRFPRSTSSMLPKVCRRWRRT